MSLILLVTLSTAAMATSVNYTWTAPTTGSPVVHYVVQISNDGQTWETQPAFAYTEEWILEVNYGVPYYLRVAGVDGLGRQGVWSNASDVLTDHGPPGIPGTPSWIIWGFLGLVTVLIGFGLFMPRRAE